MTDAKKEKWREVLTPSFMSSEESGDEEDEGGSRPVLFVKALPWRSASVTKIFHQLDYKAGKNKSKRAKLQTLPRITGEISLRPKPDDLSPNHWAFAA